MKAAAGPPAEKKGHICPPSNATHPRDRWESAFVYSFMCKFTQLRAKVEGLDSPVDFEDALLLQEPNPIITQILARFVLNLRPQTRNLSSDMITLTLAGVMQEYLKSSERTVFWDEEKKANVDPFAEMNDGFFAASWDLKLKILRQLVELQLCHCAEVKATIDRAWGVIHNKHKKTETTSAPPPASDPQSQENLQLVPLGQDKERKRYWAVDASPRLYVSTNPWKITATFHTVSSTREEYLAVVEHLKQTAPREAKPGERRPKLEQAHLLLLKVLEGRIEIIDAELARIQRARKKIEQRNLLIAQAEVRETRTRRRTTRPDYAYMNDPTSEDDQDEYKPQDQDDEEYEDPAEEDNVALFRMGDSSAPGRRAVAAPATRRSTRQTRAAATNGKHPDATNDIWSEWRGERRSSRLGAPAETQLDEPPQKRARADSTVSNISGESQMAKSHSQNGRGAKARVAGAAALRPNETVVEAVAGKKKSRFWYYAVEPIAPAPDDSVNSLPPPSDDASSIGPSESVTTNGFQNGDHSEGSQRDSPGTNGDVEMHQNGIEGSMSPSAKMDTS